MIAGMTFLDPWMLGALALVPVAIWVRLRRGEPAVRFAPAGLLAGLPRTWRSVLAPLPRILQVAAVLLAIVALARPVHRVPVTIGSEGIDIVLCLDTSSSMAARDLEAGKSRLEVAKEAAARFVGGRPHDRIALVCFARYPDVRCPFTLDHEALTKLLAQVAMVRLDSAEDATGIGTAVALSAKALRSSKAKSKVVILLTDGEETVATAVTPKEIAPVHAAQLCKELAIRIYAIAVGTPGGAAQDGRLSFDTSQVRSMAEKCDGAFFEARDAAALARIYAEIDTLEKAEVGGTRFKIEEKFLAVLASAIALFLLGQLLKATVLEVAP